MRLCQRLKDASASRFSQHRWYKNSHEVLGTHAARRTFVVHALEEGMSPEMVMTFTGHADYDTMKPYIAMTDKKRQNALMNSFKMEDERP